MVKHFFDSDTNMLGCVCVCVEANRIIWDFHGLWISSSVKK